MTTATEPKRQRCPRLKPELNTFYVARDADMGLWQFESQPDWNGFDFTPAAETERAVRLPEEWFPLLEPGCLTKVGPYGNVIEAAPSGGDLP